MGRIRTYMGWFELENCRSLIIATNCYWAVLLPPFLLLNTGMTVDPFYGTRFFIFEETDLGNNLINTVDCPATEADIMRENVKGQLREFQQQQPDRTFFMKEELVNDETQENLR